MFQIVLAAAKFLESSGSSTVGMGKAMAIQEIEALTMREDVDIHKIFCPSEHLRTGNGADLVRQHLGKRRPANEERLALVGNLVVLLERMRANPQIYAEKPLLISIQNPESRRLIFGKFTKHANR